MNTRVCLNIIFTIAIRWIVVLEGIYYWIRGELECKLQQIHIFYFDAIVVVFLLRAANLHSFVFFGT